MQVLVRLNDIGGPTAYSTEPCKVLVSDGEEHDNYRLRAVVISPKEIDRMRSKLVRRDCIRKFYAPTWIYADELDAEAMCRLFRKRGHRTRVIDEEDSCGDDTAEFFRLYVARQGEEIVVTDKGWRIFRSIAAMQAWEDRRSFQ